MISKILNPFMLVFTTCMLLLPSCGDDFLNEVPLSDYSTVGVLQSERGFEAFMTALHKAARDEMTARDNARYFFIMACGTDVADFGNAAVHSTDYRNLLTPAVAHVGWVWTWAYQDMLPLANTIITYAENPDLQHIWSSVEKRNAIIAEAKFFRAYTHYTLANLYGDVPIVEVIYNSPKTDFVRDPRMDVINSARADLEFASQWLPTLVQQEGRIVKAAADHLLTEVYIALQQYDKAVESASKVINSGLYHLMTERFGTKLNQPGDAFSDLFRDGNQNRSSGNMESIYVWQFEDLTVGGQGASNGNNRLRNWGPWYERLTDPAGRSGMVLVDSLGRGTGQVRPTPYFLYDIWRSDWDTDIRNSRHNMRRVFYYTNPSSAFFGQVVGPKTNPIDTMQNLYPQIRKIEGDVGTFTHTGPAWSGRTYDDFMVYRLAETYLLRAEAYFRMGDLVNAANDINVVRSRAKASLITPAQVTEDYILDERARELITEEPRRRILVRMNRLVDRVQKYAIRDITKTSIEEKNRWWPIPQTAIDANIGARLEQTPGY